MVRSRSQHGQCRLCGEKGPLSFEHFPPESAGNDGPARKIDIGRAVADPMFRNGRVEQRGVGAYSLGDQRGCKCNNNTGAWYGAALAELADHVANHLRSGGGIVPPYDLYPLRVLKQVITMFFSIDQNLPAPLREQAPELAAFVLARERRGLPRPFRVFVYATVSTTARSGWYTRREAATDWSFGEITHCPLGYVLTAGENPPVLQMQEITDFGDRDYDSREAVSLNMLLLPTDAAAPGDYRTLEQQTAEPNPFDQAGCRDTFVLNRDVDLARHTNPQSSTEHK